MNIMYCGDANITSGVIISVLSLCRTVHEPLHIYILTAAFSHNSKKHEAVTPTFAGALQDEICHYDPLHTVTCMDMTEPFVKEVPQANMDTRFTPGCMLRLYADLAPRLPPRLLYLDNDVICRTDPTAFYYQDMEAYSVAGVLDYYGSHFFKKQLFRRDYLNSGVLLLNMKRIQENGLFAKCRALCKSEKMFMPDQSAINRLCPDKKICPRKYNEQRKLHKNTVFQHFTTSFRFFPWFHAVTVKPWNTDAMHNTLHIHEYDSLLREAKTVQATIQKGES